MSEGGTRQEGQVEERIITGPISSPSHSRTSRPKRGTLPLHCYYEMKNGQHISTVAGCLLYLPVICLLPGQDWTLCSLRRCKPTDDISFRAPALCCRWMCCTVSIGCNLATCWLSDTERNTVCFRCNTFESRPN